MRIRAIGEGARDTLSEELDGLEGDEARIVVANEALADLEHALTPDSRRPVKLAWIAFLSCVGLAIAARLSGSWVMLASCLALGALGPMLCLWAKRATGEAAKAARRLVDREVQSLVGDLYDAEIVLPKRREMRWKRKKRTV